MKLKIMAIILLFSMCYANDNIILLDDREQTSELGLVSYYCVNGVVYMKIDHEKNTTFTPIVKNNINSIQPYKSCSDYMLDKRIKTDEQSLEKNKVDSEKMNFENIGYTIIVLQIGILIVFAYYVFLLSKKIDKGE